MERTKQKKPRAKRSDWSRYEIQKMMWLVALYQSDRINYDEVARHLYNRSAHDVKKRWSVVRDGLRRKLRDHLRALVQAQATVPYQGELHSSLRWVETQWGDLEQMKLQTH